MKTKFACLIFSLPLVALGCALPGPLSNRNDKDSPTVNSDAAVHSEGIESGGQSSEPSEAGSQRFVFPSQTTPFPASSVAIDTKTGQLCKTYLWTDAETYPRGLLLCAELSNSLATGSFTGATKSYRGFSYSFDGHLWKKGSESLKYNPETAKMEPNFEDQYDPLELLSKGEKGKRLLTEAQIRRIANQFSVSYTEAWEDAKMQGYQVPSKP